MEEKRARLLTLLKERSFRYRTDPPFRLASGQTSPYYIDCKPTTNNAEAMWLIGEIVFEMIKDLDVHAIGGPTMGADPIAHAASMVSYREGRPVNSFCVRKKQKDHGIVKAHRVEGDVRPGERVVILDDVITTGGSTVHAIEAAREFGLEVVKVVVLVDRQAGGKEAIERHAPRVEAIFTLSQFTEGLEEKPSRQPG